MFYHATYMYNSTRIPERYAKGFNTAQERDAYVEELKINERICASSIWIYETVKGKPFQPLNYRKP